MSSVNTLAFSSTTNPITLPTIPFCPTTLWLKFWVRRTGSDTRQRIIELGTTGSARIIVGSGDQVDTLSLGCQLDTSLQEITALGALPLNRWVLIDVFFGGAFGQLKPFAMIWVFGVPVASATMLSMPTGDLSHCLIGAGSAGNPFQGELANLQISVGSYGFGLQYQTWASYPMDSVDEPTTVQGPTGPVTSYKLHDQSGNGHDASVIGSLPVKSFFSPLSGPPINALALDGSGGAVLSAVQQSGGISLEAWVNVTNPTNEQSVLVCDNGSWQLVLSVGGSGSLLILTLSLFSGGQRYVLAAYKGPFTGMWTHVAATLGRLTQTGPYPNGLTAAVALYVQGQQVATAQFGVLGLFGEVLVTGIPALLGFNGHSAGPLRCLLGGSCGTVGGFTGRLAEVRVWSGPLAASDIGSRFLVRAIGNEPSLCAAYRLEQAPASSASCVLDVSPNRGVGSLPLGCSIVSDSALPLQATSSSQGVSLQVRGKLLQETLVLRSQTSETPTLLVYDATITVLSPDGHSLLGSDLMFLPDDAVTVYLDDGGYAVATDWAAGHLHSVPIPPSGTLRLRFTATSLPFTTIRVHTGQMGENNWTLIRPDSSAFQKLLTCSGSDLLSPATGDPSPLPAGSSSDDANSCAATLRILTCAFVPSPRATFSDRSLLGTITSWGTSIASGIDQLGQTIVNGVKTAGAAAGSLASAVLDDGHTALNLVTATAKTASHLVVTDAQKLKDLTAAALQAVPRYGQAAIATCVASADSLALATSAVSGQIMQTFSIIGTSIINGVTYAWRVVCAGFHDAVSTMTAFFNRIGADVMKFVNYLRWLLNWQDFLSASDVIYNSVQTLVTNGIGSINSTLSGLLAKLQPLLTLPTSIGQQTLAGLCKISIPQNHSYEELDYVMDIINRITSVSSLNIDGMTTAMSGLTIAASGIDCSSVKDIAKGLSTKAPINLLDPPNTLLTTPLQTLLAQAMGSSEQSSVASFLLTGCTDAIKGALSLAKSILTGHLNVPGWTAMLESTVLGGRQLSFLRIASLAAAIGQVLTVKLTATAQSGSLSPQPTSFAASSYITGPCWANFSLGIVYLALMGFRASVEKSLANLGTDDSAVRTRALSMGWLDVALGLVCLARGGVSFPLNQGMPQDVQTLLDLQTGLEMGSGIAQLVFTILGMTIAADPNGIVSWIKALEYLNGAFQLLMTLGAAGVAALAASKGGFTSSGDWAAFGCQSGAYLFSDAGFAVGAYSEVGTQSTAVPVAQVGLAVALLACDLGGAIAEEVNAVQQAQGG